MPRIGSAHVLGAAALFFALAGTSVAETAVRAISGADVRDSSLTGRDVRDRSLTGRDVRDRTVTAADLAPGVLRAGPAGPQGPRGERGGTGPAGPDLAGATHVRVRGDRTPAENGAALRAALASITDASMTKPYVIQLAPGVYELGDTTLAMKPDVSIAGAGAAATRITGDQAQPRFGEALVLGADRTLLRDVTVANRGAAPIFQTVMAVSSGDAMRIEGAVLEADTAGERGFPLIVRGGSSVDVRDSRLEAESGAIAVAAFVVDGADVRIRGSELVAAGGVSASGVLVEDLGSTTVVENSTVVSTQVAVRGSVGGTATVGASRVVGGGAGLVTCVASYNGNFAPVNGGCN